MALPTYEQFSGSAAVLPDPPWRQVAFSATTLNRDGSGHGKASAADSGVDVIAYDDADSFTPDQYAKAVVAGLVSSTSWCGVCVRCGGTGGSFSGYELLTDGAAGAGHTEIFKYVAGAATSIVNFAGTVANGDLIELRVIGTTLFFLKNGTVVGFFTDSSSPLLSGAPGAAVFNTVNNATLSAWEAGEIRSPALIRFPPGRLLFPKRPFGSNNPLIEAKYYTYQQPTTANTPIGLDVASSFDPALAMQSAHQCLLAAVSSFTASAVELLAFFRSLAIASAFTPVVVRTAQRPRTLSVASTFTAALQRGFPRALNVASSFVAGMVTGRAYARLIAATSTLTAGIVKSTGYQRALTVATTCTAAVTRQASRVRSLVATSAFAVAIKRETAKSLAVASVFTASLVRTAAYQRTLAVVSTFAPGLNRTAAHFLALAVASAFAVAVTVGRGFFRSLGVVATMATTITRLVTHTYLQSLAVTSTFSVALARTLAWRKALAVTSAHTPTLVRIASHPRTLAAVSPFASVLKRGIALRLTVAALFVTTLKRALGMTLAVASPFVAGLLRGVADIFVGFLTHIQSVYQVRALDAAANEVVARPTQAFEVRRSK
jgi:hypothetical protein